MVQVHKTVYYRQYIIYGRAEHKVKYDITFEQSHFSKSTSQKHCKYRDDSGSAMF